MNQSTQDKMRELFAQMQKTTIRPTFDTAQTPQQTPTPPPPPPPAPTLPPPPPLPETIEATEPDELTSIDLSELFETTPVIIETEPQETPQTEPISEENPILKVTIHEPFKLDLTRPILEETNANDIRIIQYTDKAIIVTGDTFAYKDTFKAINGIFKYNWKCGAGWMFSKKHEAFIIDLVS